MKKLWCVAICSVMMLLSATVWAAEFKFEDGTLVRGDIQGERVLIKTKFGDLTPKVGELAFVSDGKIELTDGSQIMGELLAEDASSDEKKGIMLKTKYGTFELKFKMDDIEYIDFKK